VGLWQRAAIYGNPEVDQGFGVGNMFGIAGFPSALAFKVGNEPYIRDQGYSRTRQSASAAEPRKSRPERTRWLDPLA
jgi:hypothetical protein